MSYEESAQAILPPYMQKPNFKALLGSFGASLDTQAERAQEAAIAGIVELAPVDNLPNLGKDRLLPQFPTEQIERYRARLARAFTFWRKGGTVSGMHDLLSAAFPDLGWSFSEQYSSPLVFAPSTFWAQFDVRLTANGLIEQWQIGNDHEIGEENLIIGAIGVDPFVFGRNEFQLIKKIILQTKPAYALCRYLTIDFDGPEVNFPIQASLIP